MASPISTCRRGLWYSTDAVHLMGEGISKYARSTLRFYPWEEPNPAVRRRRFIEHSCGRSITSAGQPPSIPSSRIRSCK